MVDNCGGAVGVYLGERQVRTDVEWLKYAGIFRALGFPEIVVGVGRYAVFGNVVLSDTGLGCWAAPRPRAFFGFSCRLVR